MVGGISGEGHRAGRILDAAHFHMWLLEVSVPRLRACTLGSCIISYPTDRLGLIGPSHTCWVTWRVAFALSKAFPALYKIGLIALTYLRDCQRGTT